MDLLSSLLRYVTNPFNSALSSRLNTSDENEAALGGASSTRDVVGSRSALRSSRCDVEPLMPRGADPDTHSASVNLEDLISEYDEPSSRLSHIDQANQQHRRHAKSRASAKSASKRNSFSTNSYISLNNLVSVSQSYKTARDTEETISYHSALQDGFSLDEYEWRDKYGRDFLWDPRGQNSHNRDRATDNMMQASNFQVLWNDLSYTIIKSDGNLSRAWQDLCQYVCASMPTCVRSLPVDKRAEKRDSDESNDVSTSSDLNLVMQSRSCIISSLDGSFRSSQLTAIMGPSGAGKTSLLNIVSRRCENGVKGALSVEFEDCQVGHKINISAIPQHDHLLGCLTVRENLMFASRLKNPGAYHEKNVFRVSNLLGLDECMDTRVIKISGGQQKRVSIAQELLSRPDILILDEPTSGLDSSTCLKTLSVLKDLVRASARKLIDPIAVVLTIHQPTQEAFELFDKVYVMANGGVTIYDGPPSECAQFVLTHTGIQMPSPDYNPASFMIDIASGEYGEDTIKLLERQTKLQFNENRELRQDASMKQKQQVNLEIEQSRKVGFAHLSPSPHPNGLKQPATTSTNNLRTFRPDPCLIKGSQYNNGFFCYKTRVLTQRCWLAMTRQPTDLLIRILFHLLLPFGMAFMLGTQSGQANACPVYREEYSLLGLMKSDDYVSPDVQNEFMLALENLGLLFVIIYSCLAANAAGSTLMFATDMNSAKREYYNGWYSMNSCLFARVLSGLPLDLVLPTATIGLTYVVTGQNTGSIEGVFYVYRIIITAIAVIVTSLTGQLMGMIFGTIYMGHMTTALFASQGAMLPFVLLSGFVARTKRMSKFVRGLSLFSPFKHCLEITFIARYGWNVCGCDPKDIRGREPRITGVPDKLRKFVDYWQSSQQETTDVNSTNSDFFQLMAKQVSLYNTYGIEVKSCEQVVPYDLSDFGLTESDLPYSFAVLISLALLMLVILVLAVRYVTTFKTSL